MLVPEQTHYPLSRPGNPKIETRRRQKVYACTSKNANLFPALIDSCDRIPGGDVRVYALVQLGKVDTCEEI